MCFELALKAWGEVSPNPYVGAVIVKNGKIIGKGFHKGPGKDHGEIDAIKSATESVEGSTIYCNLEPCCHTKKRTPPCAQRLVKEGFKKVVISNLDPNPEVAGKGVTLLREAGIEVVTGILEEQGRELNEVFFKHIVSKSPFVHLKWAQTLDGKVATTTGSSKWITSEASREKVHKERIGHDAILVGAKTLKNDNPSLTARENEIVVKEMIRVGIASQDNFDHELKFFSDEQKDKSILVLPEGADSKAPVKTIHCPTNREGEINLSTMLKSLYEMGVHSVYVEGGSGVLSQFFNQRLFDRLSIYIAPKILGEGVSPIAGMNLSEISEAINLNQPKIEVLGNEIFISAKGETCSQA